ncbi:hypothetical protein K9L16_01580 [Candidatus Pacearchaeota archaeon]|nr:hypothetical protein [Candidatus Pacearchaeota archaeon]
MIENCFHLTDSEGRKINLGNNFSVEVHGKKKTMRPIKISLRNKRYSKSEGVSSLEEEYAIRKEFDSTGERTT